MALASSRHGSRTGLANRMAVSGFTKKDGGDFCFPSNLKALTPQILTAALCIQHPGVIVESFRVINHAACGDGLASTADRVSLEIAYLPDCDCGLPNRVILKTILLHPYLRFGLPVIFMLSKMLKSIDGIPFLGEVLRPMTFTLVNVYQRYFPHAPPAMYLNEVSFYRDIRPTLDLEAPMGYASMFDSKSGQFGVIMEDLSLKNAHFPNATESTPVATIKNLMSEFAKLHAAFWDSPRFYEDLSWVPLTNRGGMFPVFDAIGLDIIRDQVAKNPFKKNLIAPLNKSVQELWAANWKVQSHLNSKTTTLLHGDTHIGNTYQLADNKTGLLDFQLLVRGHWVHDVAYAMITGLDINDRRNHEKEIIQHYLSELAAHGITPPCFDEAWLSYRQAAIWGLVIGWLITPPANYGEKITSANIFRMVTAMIDLDTLSVIPSVNA